MIKIQNIYYMLSYAFRTLEQKEYRHLSYESFDNIHNLLATILSKGIYYQIKRGLTREYISYQETMMSPRGKIVFSESSKTYAVNKHIFCEFDEFSENCYYNQILKTTALVLLECEDVGTSYKKSLKKSLLYFSGIEAIPAKSIQWNRLRFNRNNSVYKMLIYICYMVLHDLLISEKNQKIKLLDFLDDQKMNLLYQKFILQYYKKHYDFLKPKASVIPWNIDNGIMDEFLPQMNSDVMLYYNDKILIIDAKYYEKHSMQRNYDKITHHSNNMYQIYTYVKNADTRHDGSVRGMLLYAKTDEKIVPNSTYQIDKNTIIVSNLDLNKDFSEISKSLDTILESWIPGISERKKV